MKNWDFCIGNVGIHFEAEDTEQVAFEKLRFRKKCPESDVCLKFHVVDEIAVPKGIKCEKSTEEHPVWRDDSRISRVSWDFFREKPHFRTDYDLMQPNILDCYIRLEDLEWAKSEKYLWTGIALPSILLHHQHLIFHASYIEHHENGIIFTAPSGTGKSTQADLWAKYRGAQILNGDKACVEVSKNPMVHGIPFEGTSGICHDRSLPLKCIVYLSQAKENSITSLTAVQTIRALFENVFVDRAVVEEWNRAFELLIQLVERVPVFHLACTPDERAVETLEQAINQIG